MTDQERSETCADPDQLFPTPEELFPEWKRQPGRRGRLTKEELADRAAYDAQRDAYAAALVSVDDHRESYQLLLEEARASKADSDQQLRNAELEKESLQRENQALTTQLAAAVKGGVLMATTMAQMQYMMPGEELVPEPADGQAAGQSPQWANSRTTVRVTLDGWDPEFYSSVTVESHDASLKSLNVRPDRLGVPGADVIRVAGYLGLTNGPNLTARARKAFENPASSDPKPATSSTTLQELAKLYRGRWIGVVVPRFESGWMSNRPLFEDTMRLLHERLHTNPKDYHIPYPAGREEELNINPFGREDRPTRVATSHDEHLRTESGGLFTENASDPLGFQAEESAVTNGDASNDTQH